MINFIKINVTNICNYNCIFCGYKNQKTLPYIMSNDEFKKIVNILIENGISYIGLTPIVGEVFIDPNFIQKLHYLESKNEIIEYYFFTNFSLVNEKIINELSKLKKLKELNISIIGNNDLNFLEFSNQTKIKFEEIFNNIKLLSLNNKIKITLWFRNIKNSKEFINYKMLNYFSIKNNIKVKFTKHFDDWSGNVDKSTYDKLKIKSNKIYKNPCTNLFTQAIVLKDGYVSLCGCRDLNNELIVGNIYKNKIYEILNKNNKNFIDFIQNPIDHCLKCTFYKNDISEIQKNTNFILSKNYINYIKSFSK